ncbi:hypothetical protein B0H16DRAFT_401759 [Mycena metata]|uniref:MYND-type domain-containing protein n=1 Tax=Mycena metata TaxID=1033252 RepID=A0AAD7JM28_9AGAR|nr:hypothetical protein B0H16DRAFT_401759 [Mycena metata]
MDTSAMAASAFGSLPYFSPMMSINTSGTCATTRLTQCRDFGVYMNDVTRKFERDPEYATDLSLDDFMARKNVIEQVSRWSEERNAEWPPILYLYEIVKASAKRERDWGHLIFTDLTTTRFLLVMIFPSECDCGNFSHHDYGALTKFQADRFMSLLKYLYHTEQKPNWVRATFVTQSNGYALDPTFLGTLEPPSSDVPNIFHVTSETFVPSLLSNELESIDTLLKQSNKRVPKAVRYEVLGSKDSRPDVSPVWKSKNSRQCAHCQKSSTSDLQLCSRCVYSSAHMYPVSSRQNRTSRCRLIHYCSRECQRSAWPMHKLVCKKT